MHNDLNYLITRGLRPWFKDKTGLELAPGYDSLRDTQLDALEWALSRPEPYLFVNAPTGSGKTLMNAVYGALVGGSWTYAVHTIMLQEQVAADLQGIPVLTGRRNHPCEIGEEIFPLRTNVMADEGVCVLRQACDYDGRPDPKELEAWQADGAQGPRPQPPKPPCGYYEQKFAAENARQRVVNYSMLLSLGEPGIRLPATTLVADEAHNIEDAVCNNYEVYVSKRNLRRWGLSDPPPLVQSWSTWARTQRPALPPVKSQKPVDAFGLKRLHEAMDTIINEVDERSWVLVEDDKGYKLTPIWGAKYVMSKLLGHSRPPSPHDGALKGLRRTLFTSATLMGAEYIADRLGLPEGSWAYLDLPSRFPASKRPVNFSPVDYMNRSKLSTPEGRLKMQAGIDQVIEYYIACGRPTGIVHAVSNKYRDAILTESRYRGIMTTDPAEHAARVGRGEASVIVAANLMEGYDGVDDLVRFIIMPKVPFPNLGDKRTQLRREEDPRSYDHRTLVAVVQGAGRGVRHTEDFSDTWMLDGTWGRLFSEHKEWLPESFLDGYHANVGLPELGE